MGWRALRHCAWLVPLFAIDSSCSVEVDSPERIESVQQALCTGPGSCPGGNDCCNGFCCTGGASCCNNSCCAGSCCGTTCCTGAGNCCSGGTCTSGSSVATCGSNGNGCSNCDDGNACTTDSCAGGGCSHVKVGDGQPCPGGSCVNGACCTGCVNNGVCLSVASQSTALCGKNGAACAACSDGSVCTQDLCVNGTCDFTTAAPATTVCRSAQGECDLEETCSGTSCPANGFKMVNAPCTDDGNACTADVCNGAGACVHNPVPNNTMCTDNNVCTQGDSCQTGVCTPGPMITCNDNNDCTVDTCNPMTGCVNTPRADNETCTDGNDCTVGDKCVGGKCVGVGKDCNDNDPCTIDTCNVGTQQCTHTPAQNDTPCVNTSKCTVSSSCQAGKCTPGAAVDCSDTNPCTKNTCDPTTGCKVDPDPGAMCDDGDPCTTGEKCQGTTCGVGTPIVCDDCLENGACDKATGGCKGTPKGDGQPCTGGGTCQGGLCSTHVDAGMPDAGGQSREAGSPGEAGPGSLDSSLSATEGGTVDSRIDDGFFARDPGGCSCTTTTGHSESALAALAMLGGLPLVRRARRFRKKAAGRRLPERRTPTEA